MSQFQTERERKAYNEAADGIENIYYTSEEIAAAQKGRQDKMLYGINDTDAGVLMLALAALYKFLLRYVAFLFLGMYIPFRFFDKKHSSFSDLFVIIAVGAIISYLLFCLYIYFVRTPLLINKRIGIVNKFYDHTFFVLELVLPSFTFSAVFLYIIKGMDGSLISTFGIAVAIGLFVFFFKKLKKQIVVDQENAVPLLVKWVYNISKKNNVHYRQLTEADKQKNGLK